jgi:hypothetical protein
MRVLLNRSCEHDPCRCRAVGFARLCFAYVLPRKNSEKEFRACTRTWERLAPLF